MKKQNWLDIFVTKPLMFLVALYFVAQIAGIAATGGFLGLEYFKNLLTQKPATQTQEAQHSR